MLQGTGRSWVSLLGISLIVLSGCGGGGGGGETAPPATPTWNVTSSASGPGTITPANMTVNNGVTATFTVTPDDGYAVHVAGCNGTLTGSTYTTGPITAACSVMATFSTPTVGGTVSGLAWGNGVVLHNGTDTVTVEADGAFTFPTGIANGTSYNVTADNPPKMKCTVSNGSGTVNGAHVTNIEVTCKDTVTALYPVNGTDWNDYVKNDGTNLSNATDTQCVGDETGGYSACIHGGERRVFAVAGAQSCLGLIATDMLDAFDWHCDDSTGTVRFISGRIKYDRRLADLIDFTKPAWKENVLTVTNAEGAAVAVSASTPWWSNPLVVDNDGIASAEPKTLYLVTADAKGSYILSADKTGLVVQPGFQLSGPGNATAVVSAKGYKHLWLEGQFNAAGDDYGLSLDTVRSSIVRKVHIINASNRGIYLARSLNNSLSQLMLANNHGAIYAASSHRNLIAGVTAVHGLSGVVIDNSNSNVLQEATASNNTDYGLFFNLSIGNVASSVTLANNGGRALYLNGGTNHFADIAVANNDKGIELNNTSNNSFTGLLKLGSNTTDCVVTGGVAPGLTGTCTIQGASDATITTGITLAAAFAGKITMDDANNSDSNGASASFPATPEAFDWWKFENAFRGWGIDGSDFPASDNRGRWTIGSGRIWDWSVKTGDTEIKEVLSLPNGDDTIIHIWSDYTTTTFLRHAQEVDGDGDGLCESYETCLYTANLGAYQGHGPFVTGTFTDGTIKGVKLLRYQYNGR